MKRRFLAAIITTLASLSAAIWIAWASSPDPTHNVASFEANPITRGVAAPNEAITLAQTRDKEGAVLTLLVESYDGEQVVGVDLRDLGAPASENPFVALGIVPDEVLTTVVPSQIARTTVKVDDLLPTAPRGSRHIGIGTNFPEHAQEARSSSVFNF
ncbi:MAG: hypothetical protein AAGI88_09055, partial [Pseudomonadota bacterium]